MNCGSRSGLFAGHWPTQADAEAIARIGIGHVSDSQSDGAARIAGNVKVVSTSTHRPRYGAQLRVFIIDIFVPALRIEVVDDKLPHAAAHIQTDILKMFSGVNDISIAKNTTVMVTPFSATIADNFTGMFTLKGIDQ